MLGEEMGERRVQVQEQVEKEEKSYKKAVTALDSR